MILFDLTWTQLSLAFFVTFTIICTVLSRKQRHKLKVVGPEKKTIIDDFIAESNITRMEFQPYTYGVSPMMQTIVFIFYELFSQILLPVPFEKELFKLKDGGTLGLDWDEGKPEPVTKDSLKSGVELKPMIILIPGVAGDSDNMY